MHQQFPRIRYVSPYGLGFKVILLCCREAVFFNYQIAHGLPHPLSHRDFLECWCLNYETFLSVSACVGQTREILGRNSVTGAEDAAV